MEWSRCRSQPQQAQQTWATRKQHDMRQRKQGGQEHELHLHYPETTGDDKCMYLHVQVNSLCSMHWTRTWRATHRLCHWNLEGRLFRGKLWLFCEGLFPPPQIHRMYFTYTSEEVAGVQPYEEASQKDLFCIPSPVARSFSFPSICVSESAVMLVACNTSDTLTLKSAACTFCKKHIM